MDDKACRAITALRDWNSHICLFSHDKMKIKRLGRWGEINYLIHFVTGK